MFWKSFYEDDIQYETLVPPPPITSLQIFKFQWNYSDCLVYIKYDNLQLQKLNFAVIFFRKIWNHNFWSPCFFMKRRCSQATAIYLHDHTYLAEEKLSVPASVFGSCWYCLYYRPTHLYPTNSRLPKGGDYHPRPYRFFPHIKCKRNWPWNLGNYKVHPQQSFW